MVKKKAKKSSKSVKAKSSKKVSSKNKGFNLAKKMDSVGRRLVFFVSFFVLFLILDVAVSNELWSDVFVWGTLIFGFISVALLISYLILWFMKRMKKK